LPPVLFGLTFHRPISDDPTVSSAAVRCRSDSIMRGKISCSPNPANTGQEWVRFLAKAQLPRLKFHNLRHSHATHMLLSNIHPKIVSERLGHSKIGITLDLYSHVKEDAAARIDEVLQAAINKRPFGHWVAEW